MPHVTSLHGTDTGAVTLVRAMGRVHFRRQGWHFEASPQSDDRVEFSWSRAAGAPSTYRSSAAAASIERMIAHSGLGSAGAVASLLDGLLLDACTAQEMAATGSGLRVAA